MTIDAVARGLDGRGGRARRSRHRATGRDLARLRPPRPPARATSLLACGPLGRQPPRAAPAARRLARRASREPARRRRRGDRRSPTTSGAGPSAASAPTSRGRDDRRAQARRHPAGRAARARARSPARCSSALAANALNQLDTQPGPRARRRTSLAALAARRAARGSPSCSLPTISARWRCSGTRGRTRSGAVLGLSSVERFTGRGRWIAIGALAGLTLLGERRSLGELIERTPGSRASSTRLGRPA